MPKAIYVPDGVDPTEQEYPIPGTGLATFSLAIFAILAIAAAFGAGLLIGKPKAAQSSPTPTASATATSTDLYFLNITVAPSKATKTPTPSSTPSASTTASRSPSPSPTYTPSPTATATKRPSKTPRPAKHTASEYSGTPAGFEISVAEATFTIDDSGGLGPPLGPWTMVPIPTDTGGWQVVQAPPTETPTP